MDLISSTKKVKNDSSFILILVTGCLLLLYTISRVISLSKRIKDLESRPPVDEIILRGLIRQEVQHHTDKLDSLIKQKIENLDVKFEDIEIKIDDKLNVISSKTAPEPIVIVKEQEIKRSSTRNKKKTVNETKTEDVLDLTSN